MVHACIYAINEIVQVIYIQNTCATYQCIEHNFNRVEIMFATDKKSDRTLEMTNELTSCIAVKVGNDRRIDFIRRN